MLRGDVTNLDHLHPCRPFPEIHVPSDASSDTYKVNLYYSQVSRRDSQFAYPSTIVIFQKLEFIVFAYYNMGWFGNTYTHVLDLGVTS